MGIRSYTFIIVSNASAPLRKVKLPIKTLYLLAAIGVLSFFVTVGLSFNYVKMAFRAADYDKLQAENTDLKVQKENLKVATVKLGEKINQLESVSQKIQNLLENDSLTNRGKLNGPAVGGSKVDYPTAELLGALDSRAGIEFLKGRTAGLEERLSIAHGVAQQRISKARVTPSIWPVKGPITSHYGSRQDPFSGESSEMHPGLDISALYLAQVHAPADGKVIYAKYNPAYGNFLIIDHGNGLTTRYGHLARFVAKVDKNVKRGEVIGLVGSTGRSTAPHLHYEVRVNDRPKNPKDYLPRG